MKIVIPQALIDGGYISVQKHPEADYYIYNYTQKTMFEGYWNEYTMICRGLILNADNVVIARPFKKFFNWGEQVINFERIDQSQSGVSRAKETKKPFEKGL